MKTETRFDVEVNRAFFYGLLYGTVIGSGITAIYVLLWVLP